MEPENNLNEAVQKAQEALSNRTYSGRHPELGRMIKCAFCSRRHRETLVVDGQVYICVKQFAKDEEGNERKNLGGPKGKGRLLPHPSKLNLQLVQRTQELYPYNQPYINDPVSNMQESRTQAQRELKQERAQRAKVKRDQQKKSRKINRGR